MNAGQPRLRFKQRREPAPTAAAEQVATKAPRRGSRAKRAATADTEQSVADAFFPGGDATANVTKPSSGEPAKARRGRKPKSLPVLGAPKPQASRSDEVSPPAAERPASGNNEQLGMEIVSAATQAETPPRRRRGRQALIGEPVPMSTDVAAASPAAPTPAAKWDADTGTATFDWPSIEQVAATEGPNQTMAKLLLAAREEGANSRWPF